MEIPCSHCGKFFVPSPRHKNQIYCLRLPPGRLTGNAKKCTPILTTEETSERVRQCGQLETRAIGSNTASEILTKRKEIGFYKPSGTEEPEQNTVVKMDSLGLIAKMDALKLNIFVISDSYT